ncbi:MAG: hypothetical protein O2955_19650 [Planctomycetota bacterium]|nr:hypothetical protein [Planctomycetota bacterium]MDA1214729.1 hypothetical protein [Planctomycetota bacterium]
MWKHAAPSSPRVKGAEILRLWIDGVGVYVMSFKPTFTIGGPSEKNHAADWSIWSTLSQIHVEITRSDEGFVVHPAGPMNISGSTVASALPLRHGTILTLTDANASRPTGGAGDDSAVRLQFTQPHPLSLTGVLRLVSAHRSVQTLDAVVLVHDCCLLGPRKSHHIVCGDVSGEVRMTPGDAGLSCRTESLMYVNDEPRGMNAIVHGASTVEVDGLRFRLEDVKEEQS